MQGQYRPRQGTQTRSGGDSSMRSILIVAIIAVAIILVVSIVAGVIVMAYNGVFDNIADIFDKDKGGYTDNNNDDDDDNNTSKPSSDSNSLSLPNNLGLPVATPKKNYVSSKASNAATISGIQSEAAILVKMDGNLSIAEKNADTKVHPASMTKLMTLIVACENMTTTDALLTVEQWMVDYSEKEDGSGIGLKLGQQVSVEDALYLISFNSDTFACLMIAKHIAGSEEAFVKMMNDKAAELGLNGTHFANTTGLYDDVVNGSNTDYTYTTCRDMAAIMNCAMNNGAVSKIIQSTAKKINIYRNNVRVPSEDLNAYTRWYSYPKRFNNDPSITSTLKAIAGKTGGEDIPSSCFATVAKTSSGEMYICVVIGRVQQSGTYVDEAQSTADTKYIYKNYIN